MNVTHPLIRRPLAEIYSLRQDPHLEALEAPLHRAPAADLQREDAAAGALGIVDIHADLAVDPGADAAPLLFDLVGVPAVHLHVCLAPLRRQNATAVLFVQLAPPAGEGGRGTREGGRQTP